MGTGAENFTIFSLATVSGPKIKNTEKTRKILQHALYLMYMPSQITKECTDLMLLKSPNPRECLLQK
jgi:hypothetical protein